MDRRVIRDMTNRKEYQFLAISSIILTFSVVTIHNVAEIYIGNPTSFSFNLSHYFLIFLPLFVAIVLLLSAPTIVLPDKMLEIYAFAISFLAILIWIYSSFIVLDFGPLNGQESDFRAVEEYRVVEIAGIAFASFIFFYILINSPKVIFYFTVALNILLMIPTANALLSDPKETTLRSKPNLDLLFRFSKQQNVLILLFDAFQSDIFADVLQSDPELATKLAGFSYFPDTVGVATTTYLTMPSIHSGEIYAHGQSLHALYDRGVREGSFLNALAAAGHEVALVNPIEKVCPNQIQLCVGANEVLYGKMQQLFVETAHLLDLSVFRAVPLGFKQMIYRGKYWALSQALTSLPLMDFGQRHTVLTSNQLLEAIVARGVVAADRPVTKFIHLFNTHPPFILNSDCQMAATSPPNLRLAAFTQAQCAMRLFLGVIEYFKREEIYDQALIMLIADTGGLRLHSNYVAHDHSELSPEPDLWERVVGAASPVLLVKPPGAQGPFREMAASVQPSDIPATVCEILRQCFASNGISIFDAGTAPLRTRRFYLYNFPRRFWGRDTIPDITGYDVRGPIWDTHSWINFERSGSPN